MSIKPIICGIIIALGTWLSAQSPVGMSKEEVKEWMKEEQKEFRLDNSVIKQSFNYLKYVNRIKTKTWILYFTEEDVCKTSRLVCDYTEYAKMVEMLNGKYGEEEELNWEYSSGDELIKVELIRQEWYFTIQETKK
jgi:hypothetical protein